MLRRIFWFSSSILSLPSCVRALNHFFYTYQIHFRLIATNKHKKYLIISIRTLYISVFHSIHCMSVFTPHSRVCSVICCLLYSIMIDLIESHFCRVVKGTTSHMIHILFWIYVIRSVSQNRKLEQTFWWVFSPLAVVVVVFCIFYFSIMYVENSVSEKWLIHIWIQLPYSKCKVVISVILCVSLTPFVCVLYRTHMY